MFSFAKKLVDRFEGAVDSAAPDSYFRNCLTRNNKGHGLRVLRVSPHSVAHSSGFESWFDYIVAINGHELPMANPAISNYSYSINEDGSFNYGGGVTLEQASSINYELLVQELNSLAKNSALVTLDVWSAKGGCLRQIQIPLTATEEKPIEKEDHITPLNDAFKSVGLTLASQHLSTATFVWRILRTHQGSPAFSLRLIPYSDYIVGCDSAFEADGELGKGLLTGGGESLFSRVALSYYAHHITASKTDNVPITLYVYNHDYDVLRPVTVNLSREWAGIGQNRGLLGCDVGYGLLHRIPEVLGKFDGSSLEDDVIFENNQSFSYNPSLNSQAPSPQPDLVPPINVASPPAPLGASIVPPPLASLAPPPIGGVRKPKKKSTNTGDLSEYMNEELAKSKENETFQSKSTESLPPPPPPKSNK